MSNVLSIWRDSSRRSRGLFAGCLGVASVLFTLAPVWDSPAGAAIVGAEYGPFLGVPGTGVTVTGLTECTDTALPIDIFFEIDTEAGGAQDQRGAAWEADGTYVFDAPPEFDFAGGQDVGPAYDVTIACVTEDDPGNISSVTFEDGFVYARDDSTTTSTSSSTSTTASTTSTTASTTSTTAATTSTTAATTSTTGSTTSTTGSTTSTTSGETTTTTDGGSSTTVDSSTTSSSTIPVCTVQTTIPGQTTTSSICVTTTTDASTTSTVDGSGSSTTTTVAGSSTTAGPGTTAAPTVSDSTPAAGQLVSVTGSGFAPGSTVAVDFLSTPVRIGTLTADANGVATGSVRIPLDATPGAHQIRLTGTSPTGATVVQSIPVGVHRELPRTGDETWTTLRYALLLLGLGLVALGRGQIVAADR